MTYLDDLELRVVGNREFSEMVTFWHKRISACNRGKYFQIENPVGKNVNGLSDRARVSAYRELFDKLAETSHLVYINANKCGRWHRVKIEGSSTADLDVLAQIAANDQKRSNYLEALYVAHSAQGRRREEMSRMDFVEYHGVVVGNEIKFFPEDVGLIGLKDESYEYYNGLWVPNKCE